MNRNGQLVRAQNALCVRRKSQLTQEILIEKCEYAEHVVEFRHAAFDEIARFDIDEFVLQVQHQSNQCLCRETGVRIQNRVCVDANL